VKGWLLALSAVGAVPLTACIHDDRPATDRGASDLFGRSPEIQAPLRDRCEAHQKSAVRGPCDDAKYLAQKYARSLSIGDQVCLEGGVGEVAGAACLCRAQVQDAATNKVMLHVADAQPSSRWYRYVGTEVWFQEGAIVDLYLQERGY
jgi:hypothetical protein